MERIFRETSERKPRTSLRDRPQCERCGKPIKISSDDYEQEELMCARCAAEAKAWAIDDFDSE